MGVSGKNTIAGQRSSLRKPRSWKDLALGGIVGIVLSVPIWADDVRSERQFQSRVRASVDALNQMTILDESLSFGAYKWIPVCEGGAEAIHYRGTNMIGICPSEEFYSSVFHPVRTILHEHAHWWYNNRLTPERKAQFAALVLPRLAQLKSALNSQNEAIDSEFPKYERPLRMEIDYRESLGADFEERWPGEIFALLAENLVDPVLPRASPIPEELVPYYEGLAHSRLLEARSNR